MRHLSGGNHVADDGRTHLLFVHVAPADTDGNEPELPLHTLQRSEITLLTAPETVVVPHHEPLHPYLSHEYLPHEIVRRHSGEFGSERQHDHIVDAGLPQ